eukprot:CAMPEP_0194370928 /NCGR_PEP_ID=MMETSP0174-20130528/19270_1 /TAXON_ID=216777 /ORGANISM="Proboscia alata, Strain PI-D3" /LENGTH=283 /DNA_ID=CAMNT_0039148669 /DNA_START=72 /DNA_END=923 /DNA_ORIENTATION=+
MSFMENGMKFNWDPHYKDENDYNENIKEKGLNFEAFNDQMLGEVEDNTKMELCVNAMAVVGCSLAVTVAMLPDHSDSNYQKLIYAECLMLVVFALLTPLQQQSLTQFIVIKESRKKFEDEVNEYGHARNQLVEQRKKMVKELERLEDLQECLKLIHEQKHDSINGLEKSVLEFENILKSCKANQEAMALQNVITIVLGKADSDGKQENFLTMEEMSQVATELSSINKVEIDKKAFYAMIKKRGGPLPDIVIDVATQLINNNTSGGKKRSWIQSLSSFIPDEVG